MKLDRLLPLLMDVPPGRLRVLLALQAIGIRASTGGMNVSKPKRRNYEELGDVELASELVAKVNQAIEQADRQVVALAVPVSPEGGR